MKDSRIIVMLGAVSLALFLSGCNSGPSQMNVLAQHAREDATAEHADQFASDLWIAAETSWQEASVKLDAKSYGEADKLFLKAKTGYVRARDSAKSKREEMVKYITGMQVTIGKRLKSDLTDSPEAAKLSPARKKEFDAKTKEVEDSSARATTMVQNAQFLEAKTLVDRTMRAIFDIQQEFLKK